MKYIVLQCDNDRLCIFVFMFTAISLWGSGCRSPHSHAPYVQSLGRHTEESSGCPFHTNKKNGICKHCSGLRGQRSRSPSVADVISSVFLSAFPFCLLHCNLLFHFLVFSCVSMDISLLSHTFTSVCNQVFCAMSLGYPGLLRHCGLCVCLFHVFFGFSCAL